jgi:Ca-activated chloride channel homolog
MSFLAMPAWQAWLLVGGVGAFAAWLFFRKVRPPRVDVPSLLLWRRVFDQSRALSWWERVRRAVSLVATVLVAILLALAVARPVPGPAAAAHGRLLVVLDSSTSMLARTADGRTRWQHAVALARRLLGSAGGADVSLATTGEGLVEGPTADTALVESALDRLAPVGGDDVPWPRVSGTDTVHFVTDGARERPIDPTVVIHSVFESSPNVAVSALAVRPATSPASPGEAYFEVANYASAQQVRVTLTRGRDTLVDQSVAIGASEVVRQVVPLPAGGDPRLRAHVSASENALAEDDDAVAWIAEAQPLAVTVVTEQANALAPLLQHAPGVTTTFVTPAAYRAGVADVLIFDRWLPAEAPKTPSLAVAPPDAAWLGRAGGVERAPRWTNAGSHDVLAGIDPLTLDVARVVAYDGAGIDAIASSDAGTPLVEVVDRPDRRMVILTFGLGDSNLAVAPAFPVLVGNALEWLARPDGGEPRAPGLVALSASTKTIAGPDGRPVEIARAGHAAYARFVAPGFYDVDAGGSHRMIAVNAGAPATSNLTRTSLPEAARGPGGALPSGRAWWLYLAGIAVALVTIEWWTWNRRLTV